mmetsp:Transcript_99531/g.171328  ORF Transcript_99531/g.171328 Transcript_99531/m.171328 type:complete len:332 (+) Transcript_99531:74-1069(+)
MVLTNFTRLARNLPYGRFQSTALGLGGQGRGGATQVGPKGRAAHCEWMRPVGPLLGTPTQELDHLLGDGEGEDQLGADDNHLGDQPLEEGTHPLVLDQVPNDLDARAGIVEVSGLDAGLDNVHWGGHSDGGHGAENGGDEVLHQSGFLALLHPQHLLGQGRPTEQAEGPRGVPCRCPASTPVQSAQLLLPEDADEAPALQRLRIGLSLDLEDVQGQQSDFPHANNGAGRGLHDHTAVGPKNAEEATAVALQDVHDKRLAAELVHALCDLIRCPKAQAREQGLPLGKEPGLSMFLEDDLVQGPQRVGTPPDATLVGHQPLGHCVHRVEDSEL